jgi:putative sterol carrier protein
MTWQGGKRPPEAVSSPFARLAPLIDRHKEVDLDASVRALARAVQSAKSSARLHIQLVTGAEGESVDDWELAAGDAKRHAPKDADVIVVMRPETWIAIARGQLAPYDALFAGKLRIGGNVEAAKELVRHLSDPATPYVSPC